MKAKKEMLERHVIDGAGVYVGAGVGLPRACCVHESRHSQRGSRSILVALCPTGRGVLSPECQQLCPSLSSSQDAAGRVWRPGTQLSLTPWHPTWESRRCPSQGSCPGIPGEATAGTQLAHSSVFSAADLGVCAGSPNPPAKPWD